MSVDIIPLLKVHEYFHGLCDDALHEVVRPFDFGGPGLPQGHARAGPRPGLAAPSP